MHSRSTAIWSVRRVALRAVAAVLLAVGLFGLSSVSVGGPEQGLAARPTVADSAFRVQVYATTDRSAAETVRAEVRDWWSRVRDRVPSGLFDGGPEVLIEHAEPYYRVHVGTLSTRSEARRARSFLSEKYSDAYVVQRASATVTAAAPTDEEAEVEPRPEPADVSDRRFQVQLYATVDRDAAASFRSEVRNWWSGIESRAPTGLFGARPPITIEHDGSYHRVRMGAFPTRSEASRAQAFLTRRYPDAYVVRSGTDPGAMAPTTTQGEPAEVPSRAEEQAYRPRDLSDATELSPPVIWDRIRQTTALVEKLSRDTIYTNGALAEIFSVGCSPVYPEEVRARALAEEATHAERNIGIDLEARYGQQTRAVVDEETGSLSGTYVGLDWNLLSSGFLGNRQQGDVLESRARAQRLSGRLAQIQRTETCRARRVQERLRGMIPRLLEAKLELARYRRRLVRQAYLEGEALLDTYLQTKEDVRETERRLEILRANVQGDYRPDTLSAFPPLLKLDFARLSQATLGDSLRRELGDVEQQAISLQDDAALDTRLSVFGRYTTTRTLENRDFEFGLRFSQPLFGSLVGNDGIAEAERRELQRREQEFALSQQRENLRTVHRRFEEDQGRAIRAHYRTTSRRERVRRRLGARSIRANDRLNEALLDVETLLDAAVEKALAYGEVYEEVGRAFSAAREPFDPSLLSVHPVTNYEQRGRTGRRSIYIWSQSLRTHDNNFLIELARARKIERLIMSAGHNSPMDQVRALQREARENDIAVELLLAPNHWVRPGGTERARQRLEQLDLAGSGLHLDVEPHMFDDFDEREDELLRRYLEILRVARRTIGENELVVSVPLFWPDRVYQEIATLVDRAHLMAYGKDETHQRAGRILEVARHFSPEQRVIALRPEDYANPWKLDQAISTLQKVVEADQFALHDLESFLQFIRDEP